MQTGQVTKSRSKPRNLLLGIVPTYTGFDDVTPTNLSNSTDGDPTNGTGVGTKNAVSGEAGTFIFDMGSEKKVLIGGIIGIYSNTGNITPYISTSTGSGYRNPHQAAAALTTTTEKQEELRSIYSYCRYIKVSFNTSTSANASVILYEIVAYEVG